MRQCVKILLGVLVLAMLVASCNLAAPQTPAAIDTVAAAVSLRPSAIPIPENAPPQIVVNNPTGLTGEVSLNVMVTDPNGNNTVKDLSVEQVFNPPATGNKDIHEYISNQDIAPFTIERVDPGHFTVKFTAQWPGRFPLHFTATDLDGNITTQRVPVEVYWAKMPWSWRGAAIETGYASGQLSLAVVPHLMDVAEQLNMNALELAPHWIMDGEHSVGVYQCQDIPGGEKLCVTPTDQEIGEWIDEAHERGLQVFLAPHVLCTDCNPYNLNPPSWQQWFESYSEVVYRLATLAEEHHAEAFSIGNELLSSTYQSTEWAEVLAHVRQIYNGQVTYMDFTYWTGGDSFPFEKDLDFLGANFYPPGTDEGNFDPTVEEMDKFIAKGMDQTLLPKMQAAGKPAVATELGRSPHDGTAFDPWDAHNNPVDYQEQIDWYEAAFRYSSRRLLGVIVWSLKTEQDSSVGKKSFDIRGKPVMDMIRIWFYTPAP